MPEFALQAIIAAILGWGGFTWRKAEQALTEARDASDKVDGVELKMAEHYLTKHEFENSMDRLFLTLGEMRADMKYVAERVDYHIIEQTGEVQKLRRKLEDSQQ